MPQHLGADTPFRPYKVHGVYAEGLISPKRLLRGGHIGLPLPGHTAGMHEQFGI